MVKKTAKEMLEIAIEMRKKSYAPYSNFCVGACLECTDGKYITGCNIENSSYGATNCAERTAFFKAVSDGITHFQELLLREDNEMEHFKYVHLVEFVCSS